MPTKPLTRMRTALARALSIDDVNQLGRDTGQSQRLRTVTPHRLFLSTIAALAADLLREFNYQNDATVAYKAFYNRLARPGFAPDSEAERQFLPAPATLAGKLLLADRGYPRTTYFDAVREHGGSFIARLSRSHDPWVRAAWVDGKRRMLSKPVRLSRFVAQHADRRMDLDVEYERGKHVVAFRVVTSSTPPTSTSPPA